MATTIELHIDEGAFDREFKSNRGMVGRDLARRGKRVERAAKIQVGKRSHRLQRLISSDVRRGVLGPEARVGTFREAGVGYALFHHEGTRPYTITARPGHHLRFLGRRGVIFATSVRHPAHRPNRYLTDPLPLAVL